MSYAPQPAVIPPQYAQQGAYAPVPPQQQYAPPQPVQYPQGYDPYSGQQFPPNPVPPHVQMQAQMQQQQQQGQGQQFALAPHLQAMQQQYATAPPPLAPQYNPAIPDKDGYFTIRVMNGTHRGTRCIYRVGDVFRTRDPLHLMFENKFSLERTAMTVIEDSSVIPERMIPKTPEEVAAARQRVMMMAQQVAELAAQQAQMAQAPQAQPAQPVQQPATPAVPVAPLSPPIVFNPVIPIEEGSSYVPASVMEEEMFPFAESEDVSKRFPKARKAGLEVWHHKEKGYALNTPDPQNPTERFNIADISLTSPVEVNKYLAEMGA